MTRLIGYAMNADLGHDKHYPSKALRFSTTAERLGTFGAGKPNHNESIQRSSLRVVVERIFGSRNVLASRALP